MGILSRWFGDVGTVRYEGVTTEGIEFSGTCEIESFNNSTEEIEEKLKTVFYIKCGKRARTLKITAFV